MGDRESGKEINCLNEILKDKFRDGHGIHPLGFHLELLISQKWN